MPNATSGLRLKACVPHTNHTPARTNPDRTTGEHRFPPRYPPPLPATSKTPHQQSTRNASTTRGKSTILRPLRPTTAVRHAQSDPLRSARRCETNKPLSSSGSELLLRSFVGARSIYYVCAGATSIDGVWIRPGKNDAVGGWMDGCLASHARCQSI